MTPRALGVLVLLLLAGSVDAGGPHATREGRLKLLGEAVKDYCIDFERRLPPRLSALVDEGYVVNARLLLAVDDPEPVRDGELAARMAYETASANWEAGTVVPLLRERRQGDAASALVFFSDGRIESVSPAPPAPPHEEGWQLGIRFREQGGRLVVEHVGAGLPTVLGIEVGDVLVILDSAEAEAPREVRSLTALEACLRDNADAEALLIVLERGDEEVVAVFGRDAPPDAEALRDLDALLEALAHPHAEEREMAALELSGWGAAALRALPTLTKLLKDEASPVRAAAAVAICGLGLETRDAVRALPALLAAMRDPVPDVRLEATVAVQVLYEHATRETRRAADVALQRARQDPDPRVREAAVR